MSSNCFCFVQNGGEKENPHIKKLEWEICWLSCFINLLIIKIAADLFFWIILAVFISYLNSLKRKKNNFLDTKKSHAAPAFKPIVEPQNSLKITSGAAFLQMTEENILSFKLTNIQLRHCLQADILDRLHHVGQFVEDGMRLAATCTS